MENMNDESMDRVVRKVSEIETKQLFQRIKQPHHTTSEYLKKSYKARVTNDTKEGFSPEMTEQEFISIWQAHPQQLLNRKQGRKGYMMMRVDFDKPLSKDNYQIIIRGNRHKHYDYQNYPQKTLRDKISKSQKGKDNTEEQNQKIKKSLKNYFSKVGNSEKTKARKSKGATKRWGRYRVKKLKDAIANIPADPIDEYIDTKYQKKAA